MTAEAFEHSDFEVAPVKGQQEMNASAVVSFIFNNRKSFWIGRNWIPITFRKQSNNLHFEL